MIITAAKRIFNSDKICCSYYDFYFGVTFFGTHCIYVPIIISLFDKVIAEINGAVFLLTTQFVSFEFARWQHKVQITP